MWMFVFRTQPGPKFRGPPLTGTARVLAVPPRGLMSAGGASFGNILLFLRDIGATGSRLCSVGLRVEIPGRQPYDVTVWRIIDRIQVRAMGAGRLSR
jgi:hypothetical protein